ncbi:MAG: pyridoxamine 5'-phosphate oxidase family protein, partial [Deltaproteobacteria bacterium]|nr:pyridoxamine 5'-phosphate oxidase family protein [Deltaproteobacteria bacterium]
MRRLHDDLMRTTAAHNIEYGVEWRGEGAVRRKDKEVTRREDIEEIIRRAQVCRIALCEGSRPYVVPLCFGYEAGVLYFHCAPNGRKMEILENNQHVCFEMDVDHELVPGEASCTWGFRYRSVVGFGRALWVRDPGAKRDALRVIMRHYSEGGFDFPEDALARTVVIKVVLDDITGKIAAYRTNRYDKCKKTPKQLGVQCHRSRVPFPEVYYVKLPDGNISGFFLLFKVQRTCQSFHGFIPSQNIDKRRDARTVAVSEKGEADGKIEILTLYTQITDR